MADWECPICTMDCEPFASPQALAGHLVEWHDEWLTTRQLGWVLWQTP